MSSQETLRAGPALLLACASALWPSAVAASPLFDLIGDTTGMGGLQARAVPSGPTAAYFNPALLIDSPAGFHVGFVVLRQQIGIELAGRPGASFAVPPGIANAGRGDASRFDNYPIPTNDLQFGREDTALTAGFDARPRQRAGSGLETLTYEAIGLSIKLFEDRLALAFTGLIPNGQFTRMKAFFNDEREQYFTNSLHPELYADRMTAPSLAFGAGVRLAQGLSLGVGATLNLAADVIAPTYVVDTGDLEKILIDMDGGVNVSLSPHFGLSYVWLDRLRVTATAHAPRQLELGTGFTFLLSNGVEQSSGVPFVLNYSPWQFGAGLAWDLVHGAERTFSLVGGLQYAAWHTYLDRHGDRPTPAYPWSDTLAPTLGIRYASGRFGAYFDTAYTPTPVPDQTGRTNYVDNDRVGVATGGEVGFELLGTELSAGLSIQGHRLLARSQSKFPTPTHADGENAAPELVKDEVPDDAQISGEPIEGAEGLQTNNPGWPGFGSKGWVFAASLYLRVHL